MPATLAAVPPPSRHSPDTLGLGDPSRFRTIRHVPVLDQHEPIEKTCYDPAVVSPSNPRGLVKRMLEVDRDDLATIARNSNSRAVAGRPSVLQLGHTPIDKDKPESYLPAAVGFATNYSVEDLNGVPHLFADLHCRVDQYDTAMSFPGLSVERVGWDDPETHEISAIALIRRRPERDLPSVPYEASTRGLCMVLYSRERPSPSTIAANERRTGDDAALVEFAVRNAIFDRALARREFNLLDRDARANYAKDSSPTPVIGTSPEPSPQELAAFAASIGCFDPSVVRQRFAVARARGDVSSARSLRA
jgi:hypothetical protein